MSTVQTKQTNLREKLAELLDFRKMRDRLSGLGLYIGKDRTGTDENLLVRGGANVDDLQIGEIAALVGGTAVDVFVYDTGRDSDGGKWRERTQHTSWYNEELNTATRGARREFPAVAVIVAEANKVTIYDGDDPDLSMWMVFNADVSQGFNILASGSDLVLGVEFLNGIICVGMDSGGLISCNFITESTRYYRLSNSSFTGGYYNGVIADRNLHKGYQGNYNETALVNDNVNDVAMTILPNAPIDENTGLPVPTIAVATDGGYSIIKDDGTVVDGTSSQVDHNKVEKITFTDDNRVAYIGFDYNSQNRGRFVRVDDLISTDATITTSIEQSQNSDALYGNSSSDITGDVLKLSISASNYIGESFIEGKNGNIMFGNVQGLFLINENVDSPSNGIHAGIKTSYNTGWMPGDIKLATLSDTAVETVGVNSDELIENGGFDSDTSGWTQIASDWTVSNGAVSSTVSTSLDQEINCIIGQRYLVSFDITDNYADSQNGVYIRNEDLSAYEEFRVQDGSTGTFYFEFTANSSIHYIRLYKGSQSAGTLSFDNISVRATTELITNGDFSNGTTGWSGVSATISIDTQRLKVEVPANTWGAGVQTITGLTVGKTYVLSATITNGTGQGKLDNSGQGVSSSYFTGTQGFTFTCTNSSMTIRLYAENKSTSNYAYFDNISVRPAVDDRSVNNNGLQIVGAIDKTPVAPGADLVAYSGFSEYNYLVQPYNQDLDFGTGDFSIMGWVKQPAGQTSYLIDRRSGTNNGISISINTSNLLYISVRNGTSDTLGGVNFPTDSWAFMCCVRRDGIGYIYVNGILLLQGNLDDDASEHASLVLGGINYLNTGDCAASLALFRISATAPTAAQIAKIYRDEKALFTDGAQATLYGSSDAVTALAYDEKTELLHVGTASGRSDFSGLRRINNTTTAITTSISAHNNLIAEQ
jgi:hypothetical protein